MVFGFRLPKYKFRLFVFFLYNILYVLYMMGHCSQSLYWGVLACFCGINAAILLHNRPHKLFARKEFLYGCTFIGVFVFISLVFQIVHFDFKTYLISDSIRLALPLVNAFLFVNTVKEKERDAFFNILLFRFMLHFIWQNYQFFNLAGLSSISWMTSNSEMESSLAHDFLIMEMFYLCRRDKTKALLCCIMCMLSMKRLSFILAPTLLAFSQKIPVGKVVKYRYRLILKTVAVISPFLLLGIYSTAGQQLVKSVFNIDLNAFMSGRVDIYQTLNNNIPYYNGLGSVNHFLTNYVWTNFGTTWNALLHNDYLRIYLETTIIGVWVFTNSMVEMSKKEYWHFLMLVYLIFVLITSHILNYFSVWIVFYMVVFSSCNTKQESANAAKIAE